MSSGGPSAAKLHDASDWSPAPITGAGRIDAIPAPFQYFAAYWHKHRAEGGLPLLDILEKPAAPPISASGIVFAAEAGEGTVPDFRVHRASDLFDFYYRRNIRGCRVEDLFEARSAARRRERYAHILHGDEPHYSNRKRSRVPGREIVWIERIYAPFADESGAPAFIAGLVKLAYA